MHTHWNEIGPPLGEVVEVRTAGGMEFLARLDTIPGAIEGGGDAVTWVAAEEGKHPYCWTDGVCWGRNADGCASDQVVAWRRLKSDHSPDAGNMVQPDMADKLDERIADEVQRVIGEKLHPIPCAVAEAAACAVMALLPPQPEPAHVTMDKLAASYGFPRAKQPEPAADLVIRVEKLIARHVKADATGLAPAVIGYHLFGFDDAARAVVALFQPQVEAAEGLLSVSQGIIGDPHLGGIGQFYGPLSLAIDTARAAGLGVSHD